MNERTLRVLEYPKIHRTARPVRRFPAGKALLPELTPSDDPGEIARMQRETTDALGRVYQKGSVLLLRRKGSERFPAAAGDRQQLKHPGTAGCVQAAGGLRPGKSYSRKTNEEIPGRFPGSDVSGAGAPSLRVRRHTPLHSLRG